MLDVRACSSKMNALMICSFSDGLLLVSCWNKYSLHWRAVLRACYARDRGLR